MQVDPIKFYFVKPGAHGSLSDDLRTISEQLGTYSENNLGVTADDNSLTISYTDTDIKSTLSTEPESNQKEMAISSQMTLTCNRNDNVSVNLLKGIVKGMGYRVYNPILAGFSTTDPNLMDLTTATLDEKLVKIFEQKRLTPIFQYINSLIFYAKDPQDDSIHLINRHILQSALDLSVNNTKDVDFNVRIASDIAVFIALADRGVIPNSFYHRLFSGDNDIYHHNLSGLDLENVETDIYLSPVFFHLDRARQSFVSLNAVKSINVLRKIPRGESLKDFVTEIVEQHQIEPLIAVRYPNSIQFLTENTGRTVPRLNISIFVGPQ